MLVSLGKPDIPEVILKLSNRRQRRQAIFHRNETEMTSALGAGVDPFWLKPGHKWTIVEP
jgi:hypothetical protein